MAAFRPLPLAALARWIFEGLEAGSEVMGLPQANLAIPSPRLAGTLMGRSLAAPLGVAAGPHTQLAQNLVAAWLCGARVLELKTVQVRDELEISRPCIDAEDLTYNCEWSQELRLDQSFAEYLKAWVLIHALAHRLGLSDPGACFVASVGYDLEGLQSPPMQRFLASLRDASAHLPAAVDAVAAAYPPVRALPIPSDLSHHVTLSTMHGCPPSEIERIARHLMVDLGLATWVKLNPTLLGAEQLRNLLNARLGHAVTVPDAAFAHDPAFPEAMAMTRRLAVCAREAGRGFGLKLSNTLEVLNHRAVFPTTEGTMYLSGRALHPLTLTLAQRVTEALGGEVPISFCGGADAQSFPDLVADGLGPVTVCTDLLRPGGYARLQSYLANLEAAMDGVGALDLAGFIQEPRAALARHAARVAEDPRFAARNQATAFKGSRPLGPFDCISAPCQEACPAHQDIPAYLAALAAGRPQDALSIILRANPLPGVTGRVCEQPCAQRCVRQFFDEPLAIRALKRHAFQQAEPSLPPPQPSLGIGVALVGGGPAGVAAAVHLAQLGFSPEIFEARSSLGGMVQRAIPGFRLEGGDLARDLERLQHLGVPVHLNGAVGRELSLRHLLRDFPYVFLGVGAQIPRSLGLPGENLPGVVDALAYLADTGVDPSIRRVRVIGGGNTALDAARAARRRHPEAEVTLVYRRTRAQMPADPEALQEALGEGVTLRDLLGPLAIVAAGEGLRMQTQVMRLGEPDASGRPRPEPVAGAVEILDADLILVAVGQVPRLDFLEGLDLARHPDGTLAVDPQTGETSLPGLFAGGDAARGPASVIQALADGLRVATELGRRHQRQLPAPPPRPQEPGLLARKARSQPSRVPVLTPPERLEDHPRPGDLDEAIARAEASRCLACDELCSLCVTVCPNRAHQAYAVLPGTLELPRLVCHGLALVQEGTTFHPIRQATQTCVLADACNACGNCVPFCPAAGEPFRDKPRIWLDRAGYEADPLPAFHLSRVENGRRLEGRMGTLTWSGASMGYATPKAALTLDPATARVLAWTLGEGLAEGEVLDLSPLALLLRLRSAADALPLS